PVPLGVNLGIDGEAGAMPEDAATREAIKAMLRGRLLAWDPVRQRVQWAVEQQNPWNGGTLATAGGLVFQGNGRGEFVAYDAGSGQRQWQFNAQTGIVAAPVSYAVDGEQYVAVLAGWGGIMPLLLGEAVAESAAGGVNRVLVFKLDGDRQLPELPVRERVMPTLPPLQADATEVALGRTLYHRFCFACHGDTAVSGGVLPDLRYSAISRQATAWSDVVLGGALRDRGMVSFAPVLEPREAEAIRAYVIKRARDEAAFEASAGHSDAPPGFVPAVQQD
ncbi:MAG: c-type cytochrome, partial [Chromatocurvus sp.]